MSSLQHIAERLEQIARIVARVTSWLLVVMVAVICADVITRKINLRLPYLDSTRLQELEWHLHGILFLLCLGYGYIRNVHVRIDVLSARFSARMSAWMELAGCLFLAIPSCLVIIYLGFTFFHQALLANETSEAVTGLPYRWVIKAMIPLGMTVLLVAVVAVALRQVVILFGAGRTER
jgi:TRAP-type mannitol/chloroaromatic compound transport system permease small subunit